MLRYTFVRAKKIGRYSNKYHALFSPSLHTRRLCTQVEDKPVQRHIYGSRVGGGGCACSSGNATTSGTPGSVGGDSLGCWRGPWSITVPSAQFTSTSMMYAAGFPVLTSAATAGQQQMLVRSVQCAFISGTGLLTSRPSTHLNPIHCGVNASTLYHLIESSPQDTAKL